MAAFFLHCKKIENVQHYVEEVKREGKGNGKSVKVKDSSSEKVLVETAGSTI